MRPRPRIEMEHGGIANEAPPSASRTLAERSNGIATILTARPNLWWLLVPSVGTLLAVLVTEFGAAVEWTRPSIATRMRVLLAGAVGMMNAHWVLLSFLLDGEAETPVQPTYGIAAGASAAAAARAAPSRRVRRPRRQAVADSWRLPPPQVVVAMSTFVMPGRWLWSISDGIIQGPGGLQGLFCTCAVVLTPLMLELPALAMLREDIEQEPAQRSVASVASVASARSQRASINSARGPGAARGSVQGASSRGVSSRVSTDAAAAATVWRERASLRAGRARNFAAAIRRRAAAACLLYSLPVGVMALLTLELQPSAPSPWLNIMACSSNLLYVVVGCLVRLRSCLPLCTRSRAPRQVKRDHGLKSGQSDRNLIRDPSLRKDAAGQWPSLPQMKELATQPVPAVVSAGFRASSGINLSALIEAGSEGSSSWRSKCDDEGVPSGSEGSLSGSEGSLSGSESYSDADSPHAADDSSQPSCNPARSIERVIFAGETAAEEAALQESLDARSDVRRAAISVASTGSGRSARGSLGAVTTERRSVNRRSDRCSVLDACERRSSDELDEDAALARRSQAQRRLRHAPPPPPSTPPPTELSERRGAFVDGIPPIRHVPGRPSLHEATEAPPPPSFVPQPPTRWRSPPAVPAPRADAPQEPRDAPASCPSASAEQQPPANPQRRRPPAVAAPTVNLTTPRTTVVVRQQ